MTSPNFLIIGAEKSGTTWLHDRLRRHPSVFMPSVKELHYFNARNSNLEPQRNFEEQGRDWYESHFRDGKGKEAIGEATPMYLCDRVAPERIHQLLPNVQLIACLRYPTDRAYSHYWMARGKNHTEQSFEELVHEREERFIERGRYGRQLNRCLEFFNRDQLLILIHEELFAQPVESLNRICSFLGIDDEFFRDQSWVTETVHGASAVRSTILHRMIGTVATWMRKHGGFRGVLDFTKKIGLAPWLKQANRKKRSYPKMRDRLRQELDEYYLPTIQSIEQILGRRVDAWRVRATVDVVAESH